MSPEKFVKPADLLRLRRKSTLKIEQSPMKCLNNFTDPSPTKKLPTLLRNPFTSQGVKRKLQLGAPGGCENSPVKSSNVKGFRVTTSPRKSPSKKNARLSFGMDEDANLDFPKMKNFQVLESPRKAHNNNNANRCCHKNDWTLKTKLKISFREQCKNWNQDSLTTHKRHNASLMDDESPTKLNDKTISIEAIKNAATFYQFPYLSWMPLFPRSNKTRSDTGTPNVFNLKTNSEAVKMLHKDWCNSLRDLSNLLLDGRCSFFYLCADIYTILFQYRESGSRAYISPMSTGMTIELQKAGVQLKCGNDSGIEEDSGSFEKQLDDDEIEEELGLEDDEVDNEDATQFLSKIGWSAREITQEAVKLSSTTRKLLPEESSSQSTNSTSNKPLAVIEGYENINKLVNFLTINRTYTAPSMISQFANIPPTLLAPTAFRLCTPQNPELRITDRVSSHNAQRIVDEYTANVPPTPPKEGSVISSRFDVDSQQSQSIITDTVSSSISFSNNNSPSRGPKFVELRGPILPNFYKRLHKLFTVSDNMNHTCMSNQLESSAPFGLIQFP